MRKKRRSVSDIRIRSYFTPPTGDLQRRVGHGNRKFTGMDGTGAPQRECGRSKSAKRFASVEPEVSGRWKSCHFVSVYRMICRFASRPGRCVRIVYIFRGSCFPFAACLATKYCSGKNPFISARFNYCICGCQLLPRLHLLAHTRLDSTE